MVLVVISGLPLNVDPTDLADKINTYFGKNREIGTFRMVIDDTDIRKPKAVLQFQQGFDAMEAQRLLDNFKYSDPDDNMLYNIKAIVPTNDQPYLSLFSKENTDIADEIQTEKHKRKKERKAKKRKHSPVEEDFTERLGLSKEALEAADIKKLEKLCKKLKKKQEKAERRSSQSEHTSESEHKKRKKDKSIHGESSGMSKMPRSPEDSDPKCKGQSIYGESSKNPPLKSTIHKRSWSPGNSTISSDSEKEIPKSYERPHTPDDTASAKSHDSRKVNIDKMEYKRRSESRSTETKSRLRSELYDSNIARNILDYRCDRPREDLRHNVGATRLSIRVSRPKDCERDPRNRARVDSPSKTGPSHSEGPKRSEKDRRSSYESTDSELITVPKLQGKKLLLTEPSQYLNENDSEFKEALAHIIHTVSSNTERLQEDDKKLIIENYSQTVTSRLKSLKFTNLMSVQDIVLDYKLVYKTADDKLLIDTFIKELQVLGKGILLPEIKRERLDQAIDEVLKETNIDELMEDIKPEIKTESTLEYEYEDGETTEVINIVLNLLPIEKRALPVETDPDKITDIKIFVSKLKKTRPSKFFRPIRSLLNEMKLFIYKNSKVVPGEVILNRMVEVLDKILARMLGPVKTRVKSRDVCNLFRNSFPYKEDREFVDMIIKWILDGEFDKGGIDGLISDKIVLPKPEKPSRVNEGDNATNEQTGTAPIDTRVPIKTKVTDNDDKAKEKEQTATTNTLETVEQITKDVQKEPEVQTEVKQNVDDDVIIKREPIDVIVIEDDYEETTNKSTDGNVPGKSRVKLENISDSEDSVMSDDSRTTMVIETKPHGFIGNCPAIGLNDEDINQGAPVKNEPVKLEKTGEAGEKLGESGEIMDEPGETIDDIRQYLKSERD